MLIKPSDLILQLAPDFTEPYIRLYSSMNKIIELVENENNEKGFYNPKLHIIEDCLNNSKFEEFQSIIKGLHNRIYYGSLILSAYSIFEHSLKSICLFIDEHYTNSDDFLEKSNYILENCINYLKGTKLIDFKDNELNKHYIEITQVQKLRNLIAHSNGNIIKDKSKPLDKQKHYILFNSDKKLIIVPNGQVYINDSDYILSFIKNSEEFLRKIKQEIEK